MQAEPPAGAPPPDREKEPWRLSWILIAILLYALLQTAYLAFFGKG